MRLNDERSRAKCMANNWFEYVMRWVPLLGAVLLVINSCAPHTITSGRGARVNNAGNDVVLYIKVDTSYNTK